MNSSLPLPSLSPLSQLLLRVPLSGSVLQRRSELPPNNLGNRCRSSPRLTAEKSSGERNAKRSRKKGEDWFLEMQGCNAYKHSRDPAGAGGWGPGPGSVSVQGGKGKYNSSLKVEEKNNLTGTLYLLIFFSWKHVIEVERIRKKTLLSSRPRTGRCFPSQATARFSFKKRSSGWGRACKELFAWSL